MLQQQQQLKSRTRPLAFWQRQEEEEVVVRAGFVMWEFGEREAGEAEEDGRERGEVGKGRRGE